jgi:riboflavin synthase
MFTGIIEELGEITAVSLEKGNRTFHIKSAISPQLSIDESVSHNGICLTIENIENDIHSVTAIQETIVKTNASLWGVGDNINLERAIKMNDRLDGHIVQGHVDGTAGCTQIIDKNGSKEFTFKFDKKFAALLIEKGSVCLNGVSLTVFNVSENEFTVAIIPYTMAHTNFSQLKKNSIVNIEFDVIGKYVQRIAQLQLK